MGRRGSWGGRPPGDGDGPSLGFSLAQEAREYISLQLRLLCLVCKWKGLCSEFSRGSYVWACECVDVSMYKRVCVLGKEEGGGREWYEQSSGFKLIFLKIIVSLSRLQATCLVLASDVTSGVWGWTSFSGTQVFPLRSSADSMRPTHINMDYLVESIL